MQDPLESDWKKFRAMLPGWRERYLARQIVRLVGIVGAPKKTQTERFWEAENFIRKEAHTVQRCLDDIRRSRMWERLWEMRAAGMITREDLADFSPGLQSQIFHDDDQKMG